MNRPKVILDSKGLLYHMYYRGDDPHFITTKSGKVINSASWGFVNWLDEYILPILKDFNASEMIAAYDGGNEYRTALFPAYKEARNKAKLLLPPEESQQLKLLEEASKAFLANLGIICVQADGVEADDLIAAICKGYPDVDKVIHTGDADLLQLDDEKTFVYLKNTPVHEVYKNTKLSLVRMHKTIVGDKSDGYSGVPRLGQAAWDKLQSIYGEDGLQEIEQCIRTKKYAMIEDSLKESPEKVLQHLYDHRKEAEKFYNLASLHPEICYEFRGNKLIWPKIYCRVPNREKVMNVLNQMRCPHYFEKFEYLLPRQELVTVDNVEDALTHMYNNLINSPFVSFDYETVDTLKHEPFNEALPKQSRGKGGYLDVLSSEITGASFNYGPELQYVVYFSTRHTRTGNLPLNLLNNILEMCATNNVPLVAHNAAFEEMVTQMELDHHLEKPYDTMIMASYVNENEEAGLKALSKRILNYDQTPYKDLLESAGVKDMSELTGEQVLSYGCDDALVTSHLFRIFSLTLRMEGQWNFYNQNERAPVHVLNQAFRTGVNLDYQKVEELHAHADKVISEGNEFIRLVLAEHCQDKNEEAAKELDRADGDNLVALDRLSKKGMSDDALLARKQERLLRWEEATVYRPYTETYIPPDFMGTPTQLNIVAESLGINLEENKLASVSNKEINRFVTVAKKLLEGRSDELNTFLQLIAEAANSLRPKHRVGVEFEALKDFCLPFLGDGKTVSEGDELNFNSPDQMQELLYCKLSLPVRRRTKPQWGSSRADLGLKGSPASNEEAMRLAIAEDCQGEKNLWKKQVIETLLEVKSEMTKISLYYRCYPLWQHPLDGVTHPQIRNCGTVTRRPTGSNYNILQVEKGPTRAVFLPRWNDHVIVAADFSGQELRITGSESKDPTLIECYTGGGTFTDDDGMVHPVTKDVHSVTAISFAETIFQRELGTAKFDFTYDNFRQWLAADDKKISSAAGLARKMAKVVNFLIIYGGQASTLAMRLGIPEAFAEELMRLVFAAYNRLAPWQEETILFARQHGYVRTAYKTVKHLTEDIRSKDGSVRSRQERQAVNQTVQGCAADILKVVLTQSHETKLWAETDSTLIAPVYDELVCSVPVRNVWEFVQRLQDIMNITPPGHAIPMMAEVNIGPNWYEAGKNELGDRPSERKVMACIESFRPQLAAA